MTRIDFDALIAGWRGPALAALIAVLAGMPGLLLAPVLDRHSSGRSTGLRPRRAPLGCKASPPTI